MKCSVFMDFTQSTEAVGTGLGYEQIWIEQVMMLSIKSRGGLTTGRGITESVCLLWMFSMHKCAGIHGAMKTMADMKATASEQRIELGESRCKRDFQDLLKTQEWFDQHEPFDLKMLSYALCF